MSDAASGSQDRSVQVKLVLLGKSIIRCAAESPFLLHTGHPLAMISVGTRALFTEVV